MEKADNLVALRFSAGWSDLGGWDAVWAENQQDSDGVVTSEHALAIDCKNVLLRSESDGQQLVGLGLENIIAVAMPDAVMARDMHQAQNVKKIVFDTQTEGVLQAETFPQRPQAMGMV